MSRELVDDLLWLCQIPSPIGEEAEICDRLIERLGRAPLAAPIRRHGHSIVVPVTRGTGGPRVALVGHTDVVRTEHGAPPRIEGDRLYGPGAADMKSGLAVMIDLLERQPRRAVDLTLVFYAREEGPYAENELGPVLEHDPELRYVDVGVALEPSDNRLQLGCSGSLHARVRFQGRTAHSARPWQGDNAVQKAGPFLSRMAALAPEPVLVDGLEWNAVASVTLAQGGRGRNVVPDVFELNVNHRFPPGRSLEQAETRVRELVAGDAEVEFIDRSPSAAPNRHHPLIEALAASGVRAVEPKQAWTDVARFAALGVPAVNFGPGTNAQAHQKDEWTELSLLAPGRDILLRWLDAIERR